MKLKDMAVYLMKNKTANSKISGRELFDSPSHVSNCISEFSISIAFIQRNYI